MLLKSSKQSRNLICVTPQEYLLALQQYESRGMIAEEIKKASVQIVMFEKRTGDLNLIAYREFAFDDYLTRTNLIAGMMERRFYQTIRRSLEGIKQEETEAARLHLMRECIYENDCILEDLNHLLAMVVDAQVNGRRNSLSKIADVIGELEDIYINKLTKE